MHQFATDSAEKRRSAQTNIASTTWRVFYERRGRGEISITSQLLTDIVNFYKSKFSIPIVAHIAGVSRTRRTAQRLWLAAQMRKFFFFYFSRICFCFPSFINGWTWQMRLFSMLKSSKSGTRTSKGIREMEMAEATKSKTTAESNFCFSHFLYVYTICYLFGSAVGVCV